MRQNFLLVFLSAILIFLFVFLHLYEDTLYLPLDTFSNNLTWVWVQNISFNKMKIKYFVFVFLKTFFLSLLCGYFVSFSSCYLHLLSGLFFFHYFWLAFFYSITHLFRSKHSRFFRFVSFDLFLHTYTYHQSLKSSRCVRLKSKDIHTRRFKTTENIVNRPFRIQRVGHFR